MPQHSDENREKVEDHGWTVEDLQELADVGLYSVRFPEMDDIALLKRDALQALDSMIVQLKEAKAEVRRAAKGLKNPEHGSGCDSGCCCDSSDYDNFREMLISMFGGWSRADELWSN